ncbi:MAG: polyhydroxyalkanoic acid system family protein [Burkholderiaceae bacterium]
MSKIQLQRAHALGMDGAREAVQRAAEEMHGKCGLEHAWQGDQLSFSRPGVSGTLEVRSSEVVLEAELGMLLSALRGRIEEEIHKCLDHHFS